MHFGLTYFPTDLNSQPGEFAAAAEERGFESVWFAEHSHIPVGPMTPGPPAPGEGGLPREYYAAYDPFVALAVAAGATRRIKLATGICLVAQRDVFQTAKSVATLDRVSNGRFLFGVGAGWNQPEIENHGTPFDDRFKILRESIEAMKRLWTDERAEYHGRFIDFDPAFAWPKPMQSPHPPVHMGGAGLGAIRRAVAYADGWSPLWGDEVPALIPRLHDALREAGRAVDGFDTTIYFCPPDPDVIARCRDAGVARVLLPTPQQAGDEALATLDGYAALMR